MDMFSSQSVPPDFQTSPGETRADDLSILVLPDMNPRVGESVSRTHGRRASWSRRTKMTGWCDGIHHRLQDGEDRGPAECDIQVE